MRKIDNIPYGKDKHPLQKLDIYLPERESFKVVVYMHGGGLVKGDKTDVQAVGEFLTEKGVAFVSVNYRMYPEAVYPMYLEDSAEAVSWVYENIGKYGKNEGIYISGSSAGGYISMMLCFDEKYLNAYNIPKGAIKGYIHDAGQPTTHFNILKERGVDSRRIIIDEAAPLYHIGTADSYPKMLFIVSDNDMPNRFEQTQLVISTLKHFEYEPAGYKLMHGTHCHYSTTAVLGEIIYNFINEKEEIK